MLIGTEALEYLESAIGAEEQSRSAFWQAEMDSFAINAKGEFKGDALLGNMGGRDRLRSALHQILQTPIRRMGRPFGTFRDCLGIAQRVALRQKRLFTLDVLRQALSLALIREHVSPSAADALVVIGDGFGVMTALLRAAFPSNTVVVCNLIKPLLVDLTFARKAEPDLAVALPRDAAEMRDTFAGGNGGVIGVRADDASLLLEVPIGLAVNILSMQEMTYPVIERYFDCLRRNPAPRTMFYCANRFAKEWHDKTVVRFDRYPWREADRIIVDGVCEWSQLVYRKSPPFWLRRGRGEDKIVVHRLAALEKLAA
ncbi:MAG: hypothetical protein O7H40_11180 [Gammaproteobacteria bacterium]|nr:hypothetical protein [Gammaproteobacteria bacterium]